MRIIKFRTYSMINNQMNYPDVLELPWEQKRDGVMLMQFTGLKDKNGKEIWEGDIVSQGGEVYVVEYGLQEVDAFEGMGWNLWSFMEYAEANGERLQRELEVIGNIYENPELLKS